MATEKYPRLYRRMMYSLFTTSWLTGTVFFILNRWVLVEGDFGPEKHALQFPTLMVHGASAFLMMFMFGIAVASHVSVNWHLKAVRRLSIFLVFAMSFQMVSAYLLYYLANEEVRDIIAILHAIVGFTLPMLLTIHIVHAWRVRKRQARLARQV